MPSRERLVRRGVDVSMAVSAPVALDEDPQDKQVGRNEFADESLVTVGGLPELLLTAGASVESQVEGIVEVIGARARVRSMAWLAARVTALPPGLGGSGHRRSVDLLGGRRGDIERGRRVLQSIQLAVALFQLLTEFLVLGLQLVQPTEELPSLFSGKGDGSVVFGYKKKSRIPSRQSALGQWVKGSLDLVLSIELNARVRAFYPLNSVN